MHPGCEVCGDANPSGKCVSPTWQLKYCSCGSNQTANYPDFSKWKEAMAAAKRKQGERGQKYGVTMRQPAPKQLHLRRIPNRRIWNLPGSCYPEVSGGIVKAQAIPTQTPNSSDLIRRTEQQAARAGGQCNSTRAMCRGGMPTTLFQALHSTFSPPQSQSPLEGFADLLENLPNETCTELTSRLLSTVSSLPTGESRPRPVLKRRSSS
jgi:hypothetical protein